MSLRCVTCEDGWRPCTDGASCARKKRHPITCRECGAVMYWVEGKWPLGTPISVVLPFITNADGVTPARASDVIRCPNCKRIGWGLMNVAEAIDQA